MAEVFVVHDVAPGKVVTPANAEAAAAVLRAANEQGLRVECAGSGTQAIGNRRTRADVVISTRAMNSVFEYEAADLVIGVEAGVTLNEIADATRENTQCFAQDPVAHPQSTIGGVIATARAGPLRYGHGTPRDHVLGLEIVTGDGRILNLGGRVVKNVAGYDLVRLLVGSNGTLGLITKAYLRLKPIPQADETLIAKAYGWEQLNELSAFIHDEHLEAVALELVWPDTLLVRLQGNPESVTDAHARIAATAAQLNAHVTPAPETEWARLAAIELNATTVVRLADLPSRIGNTMLLAEKLLRKAGAEARMLAHAGNGIVRVCMAGAAVTEEVAFAIGEVRTTIGVTGGSVIVQSRNAEMMRRVDAYGGAGNTLQLMTKLKQTFDPGNVLAPGRFVI